MKREQSEPEENPETELAFRIADRYISIQETDGGYDYSIMGADYKVIDGGVYDNPEVSILEALENIVSDLKENPFDAAARGSISGSDELIPIDYDSLMEKAEEAERIEPQKQAGVVENFKARTKEMFHDIDGVTVEDIEKTVELEIKTKLIEYSMSAEIKGIALVGSRCRGIEHVGSDIDVAVELDTDEREDDLFEAFNSEGGLSIKWLKVDINPITAQRTGTLETYLPQVEEYLEELRKTRENEPKIEVTFTVAECSEFHNLGEFYENIPTADEAVAIWKQIPPERRNGIPGIGINLHTQGTEAAEDVGIDVLSGKRIDLSILDHIPAIKENPMAMGHIAELVAKMPEMEIDGVMSEEFEVESKSIASYALGDAYAGSDSRRADCGGD